MDDESAVERFKTFTGCSDNRQALELLEICRGDVGRAADLYFQHGASAERRPRTYPLRQRRGPSRDENGGVLSSSSRSNQIQEANGDVRPPIEPIRGPIIEQAFEEEYGTRNGRQSTSIFDTDQRVQPRTAVQRQNGANTHIPKRMSLQELFRPPTDLMFDGNWEAVRRHAQEKRMWLLINIQDVREFTCQILNRDVWSNPSVKELVKSHFIFWQVRRDEADGERVGNYYHVNSYPAIFIIDPRTGELLTRIKKNDKFGLAEQLTQFVDSVPSFDARDQMIEKTPCSSQQADRRDKQLADETKVEASFSRKRSAANDNIQNDSVESKKSRQDDDISALVDGSQRLSVGTDGWRSYVNSSNNEADMVSLAIRLPDGRRNCIKIPKMTPLKALFAYIVEYGFPSSDHQLIFSYPRRVLTMCDFERTLQEVGVSKTEVIHVERI